jgi:hypothetical protein
MFSNRRRLDLSASPPFLVLGLPLSTKVLWCTARLRYSGWPHPVTENFLARHLGGLAKPIHPEELTKSTIEVNEGAAELFLPSSARPWMR